MRIQITSHHRPSGRLGVPNVPIGTDPILGSATRHLRDQNNARKPSVFDGFRTLFRSKPRPRGPRDSEESPGRVYRTRVVPGTRRRDTFGRPRRPSNAVSLRRLETAFLRHWDYPAVGPGFSTSAPPSSHLALAGPVAAVVAAGVHGADIVDGARHLPLLLLLLLFPSFGSFLCLLPLPDALAWLPALSGPPALPGRRFFAFLR